MPFLAIYADVLAVLHLGNRQQYQREAMLFPVAAWVVCMPPVIEFLCKASETTTTFSVLTHCSALYEYFSMLLDPTRNKADHPAFEQLPDPTPEEQELRVKIAPMWTAAVAEFNAQRDIAFDAVGVSDQERYMRLVNLYEGLFFAATAFMQGKEPDTAVFNDSYRSVSSLVMQPRNGGEIKDYAKLEDHCVRYNAAQVEVMAEFNSRRRRRANQDEVVNELKRRQSAEVM